MYEVVPKKNFGLLQTFSVSYNCAYNMSTPPWAQRKSSEAGAASTQQQQQKPQSQQQQARARQDQRPTSNASNSKPESGLAALYAESVVARSHPDRKGYCPQVIPGALLKSGDQAGGETGVPNLEDLKAARARKRWTEEQLRATDSLVPLQSGTNRWYSQKGMTGFGAPRDVHGKHVHRLVDEAYPPEHIEDEDQRFMQFKSGS